MDLILRNARVLGGSGARTQLVDVGIEAGRIVAIEVLADRSRLEAVVPPELRS